MICGSAAGVCAAPGRNYWQESHPVHSPATIDGNGMQEVLPFNKARAGQRIIIGPRCMSPDTVPMSFAGDASA
jgi:hypothetical protein